MFVMRILFLVMVTFVSAYSQANDFEDQSEYGRDPKKSLEFEDIPPKREGLFAVAEIESSDDMIFGSVRQPPRFQRI